MEADIHNVDTVVLWITTNPEHFGVIVAENMFGDTLSNLGAGVMGKLCFALSASVGSNVACFCLFIEVYRTLLDRIKQIFLLCFITTALLLDHLGFKDVAWQLFESVDQVIRAGKTAPYDLAGSASTHKMTEAVLNSLANSVCRAAVITVDDELLSG
ncbi:MULTISPECIES: isocitrate/isopropylmalate family dehydrogenase [Bartonella]|uniref:isocitrate/isopropylmalate family dehydrogenase n=1 Tax=Bartonella TaxID=773 RepID=UPI002E335F63|nr:isocitrate/isopropylmalate family dehydrogenase [Bartonella henselae]